MEIPWKTGSGASVWTGYSNTGKKKLNQYIKEISSLLFITAQFIVAKDNLAIH